jgi:hypothetical protein
MCHHCKGDMWHVHTDEMAGPYNLYDRWLRRGRYSGRHVEDVDNWSNRVLTLGRLYG